MEAHTAFKARNHAAWSYPEPLPDSPQIRGSVCFSNEHADIYVGDERIERPTSQWS